MTRLATFRARSRRWLHERLSTLAPARRLRTELALQVVDERLAGNDGRVRLLDAGCDEGLFSTAVARRHPDWVVVAADLDADGLGRARARVRARQVGNVGLVRLDLTRGIAESRFDAVVALECLTEIPDDDAAVRRMAEALRPGGFLLLHVPDASWRPVLPTGPTRWREEVRHGYTPDRLRTMLDVAGLQVLEIRPSTRVVVQAVQELRERWKHASVRLRAVLYPVARLAVVAERRGFTWGEARAWFVVARRPGP